MDLQSTLLLALFFLLAEGFFSGSEYVLISFSRVRLRYLAESGMEGARIIEELLKKPDKIFGATSIGTNICVFAGAALVTAYIAAHNGKDDADLYSFLIMGPVTLIFGEIVPKIIFRQRAEQLAPYIARPLARSQKLFTPILWLTSAITRLIGNIFLRGTARAVFFTREELLLLTRRQDVKLNLQQDEREMIQKIFAFKTSTVDAALQPLVNLVAVSANATIAEAKSLVADTGYSRLPVYHDRVYNIVGIVSAFDLLRHDNITDPVDKVMATAHYTPITRRNQSLLKEMNERHLHMVVVVDEYGGSVGVVTMEDLVEEIVGEIEDEYDPTIKLYERLGEGRYLVDAMMEVDAVNESLGLSLPTGDYETMSGLLIDALERIPKKRTRLGIGRYLITVLDANPRRALSVEIDDLCAIRKDHTDSGTISKSDESHGSKTNDRNS